MPLYTLSYHIIKFLVSALIVIAVVSIFAGCTKPTQVQQEAQTWEQPYFGFNAKGLMNPGQQVMYAQQYFSQATDWIKPNLVVRVTGGTASQTAFANNWTDEVINGWTALQQQHRLRFIYVVNGNDSPANQRAIIQSWINAGARFDFLEMMNEYYLPKFANGDTGYEEVSRVVTPEIYANEILPAFWAELDDFNLPYYIIFAPSRPDQPGAQQKMDYWNSVMIDSVIHAYPQRNINATLHLYSNGDNLPAFDYSQIDRLRLTLPADRRIAITEAGIINNSISYEACGSLAISHYKNILPQLQKGDYLLDQVLYNESANNNTADLNPVYTGVTPKGSLMLQFINNQLR